MASLLRQMEAPDRPGPQPWPEKDPRAAHALAAAHDVQLFAVEAVADLVGNLACAELVLQPECFKHILQLFQSLSAAPLALWLMTRLASTDVNRQELASLQLLDQRAMQLIIRCSTRMANADAEACGACLIAALAKEEVFHSLILGGGGLEVLGGMQAPADADVDVLHI